MIILFEVFLYLSLFSVDGIFAFYDTLFLKAFQHSIVIINSVRFLWRFKPLW